MYLPKSKYKEPKYTRGNEFTFRNGNQYVGWYVELYNGGFVTGKQPSNNSKTIIPIPNDTLTTPPTPKLPTVIQPTQKDYNNGFFRRYFVFDNRTRKTKEVTLETYRTLEQKGYITGVVLRWILTSPGDDLIINGYRYQGSGSKNELEIQRGEKIIPGIRELLKDPKQFVI